MKPAEVEIHGAPNPFEDRKALLLDALDVPEPIGHIFEIEVNPSFQ